MISFAVMIGSDSSRSISLYLGAVNSRVSIIESPISSSVTTDD